MATITSFFYFATAEPTNLNLLLPKSSVIDAEFEFHGSEEYSAEASVSSSNKVKLYIEFETVNLTIAP